MKELLECMSVGVPLVRSLPPMFLGPVLVQRLGTCSVFMGHLFSLLRTNAKEQKTRQLDLTSGCPDD